MQLQSFENRKTDQTQSLYLGLREFGLNPQDWVLRWHQPNEFLIENIFDQDFIFIGRTDNNRWKEVRLLSL